MERLTNRLENSPSVVFDYTHFLCDSQQAKWTFFDVFRSLLPTFNAVLQHQAEEGLSVSDKLKSKAANVLSFQVTDAVNLIRLIELAKRESISQLDVLMPYQLDNEQLAQIRAQTQATIKAEDDSAERLHISFE